MPGLLTVVATPIGNLEDITLRALRVLREADFILAEDTRHTRTLCSQHDVETPLRSLHQHTDDAKLERIAEEIAQGATAALVSDAGTPIISDPGARLVAAVWARGGTVDAAPGPSAVTTAISLCGVPADRFQFLGFLPRSGGKRTRALEALAPVEVASVLFEAPNRLADTLGDLAGACGAQRPAAVCRELTKLHQEIARGSLGELAERFSGGARGEITLVVAGFDGTVPLPAHAEQAPLDVDALVRERLARGQPGKQIARELARETGQDRRALYARVVALSAADD